MMNNRYREAWEGFWTEQSNTRDGVAIWDADPSLAAEPHLALFTPYIDPGLPIVDLGCGSGTQTRHLATRFARAIGVDLSQAAVEHARRADSATSAEFEQLNLADAAAVRVLHERLGDCNVYMRAVIHQSDPQDRAPVAAAVAELAGARGRAFVLELTSEAKELIEGVAQAPGGAPAGLGRVFAHGLKPGRTQPGEVEALLRGAGLTILASGAADVATGRLGPDGDHGTVPGEWFVAGRG